MPVCLLQVREIFLWRLTWFYYILNALELNVASPEIDHKCVRLIIVTGAYSVINFGYLICGKEGLWVDTNYFSENIEVGKTYKLSLHQKVPLVGIFKGDYKIKCMSYPFQTKIVQESTFASGCNNLLKLRKQKVNTTYQHSVMNMDYNSTPPSWNT